MSSCILPDTDIVIPALAGQTINADLPIHGRIRNLKTATEAWHDLEIRFATVEDLDTVIAMHHAVLARTRHPGDFRQYSRAYLAARINAVGRILAIFADARLIAFGALSFPTSDETHCAQVLGFSEDQKQRTVELACANLASDWVGNGLHLALIGWRIEIARAQGYRHICATAAPTNGFSWNNLCLSRLQVRYLGPFYGGWLRYLLHRDLEQPADLDLEQAVWIPITELERQRQALADGWLGFAYRGPRGAVALGFAPRCGG